MGVKWKGRNSKNVLEYLYIFFNSDEVNALANFANLDDESLKLLKKWTSRDKIAKLRSTFVGQINAEKSDVFDFSSYEDMIEPKENWDS